MSTILPQWCGLSANLECMSECGARDSLEMQDANMTQKNRHLGTIAPFCWTISL